MVATSTPPPDNAGAGSLGSGEHIPALPGLSQDCPGGQKGTAQQVSLTQLPDRQSAGSSQGWPFSAGARVDVTVGVLVAEAVAVTVGVAVRV